MSFESKHKYSDELLGLLGEFSGRDLERVKTIFSPEAGRAHRRWVEPEGKIGDHATSLTALERELLVVHRAELGQLMQDACLRLYVGHEKLGAYVVLSTPSDFKLKPEVPGAWKDHAERARSLYPDPTGLVEPLRVMSALMSGGERQPDLLEVAQAGLRIAPSATLRRYRALGCIGKGDLAGGEQLLRELLGKYTPALERMKATSWLASVADMRDDHAEAAKWSRIGALESEPIPLSSLNYLLCSVQAGDEKGALEAAHLIPDALLISGSAAEEVVSRFCRILSTDRLAGKWQPTPAAAKFVAGSRSGLSPHAQRILNVLR